MEIETIITVHDGELIRHCEDTGQFRELSNYSYLYVGRRPITKDVIISSNARVIHARLMNPNYEDMPHFYDFTGWWAMAHHWLFRSKYIITLQYDMHITGVIPLEERCIELLDADRGPVAFTAGHNEANNFMLLINGFRETYERAMAERGVFPQTWPYFNEWPSTQGMAWRVSEFTQFMRWFKPFFDLWKDEVWAGHLAERTVKAWTMVRGAPERYLVGAIRHEARDCHGTGALMAGNVALHSERAASFGQ